MYDVHSRFELPVLIMTEVRNSASKSSQENMCAETQKLLSSMGYIVSNCGQDIFAMLRPENI